MDFQFDLGLNFECAILKCIWSEPFQRTYGSMVHIVLKLDSEHLPQNTGYCSRFPVPIIKSRIEFKIGLIYQAHNNQAPS